jgi:sugar/nucleoside kinase (ribokinase family)
MAGSMKKGALPPDPRVVHAPDPAAPPVIASTGVGDCTNAGIAHFLAAGIAQFLAAGAAHLLAAVTAYRGDVPGGVMFADSRTVPG